jgi:uracil-DNA glycosylase family 4
MTRPSPIEELRTIAAGLELLDVACYRKHGRDPFEPLLGLGAPDARWCFFGRDPGEQEVRLHTPFVGDSGQRIRAVMHESNVRDADVFWMNTVPYKPVKNHPWSMAVRRRCQPALLRLLARWQGHRVITFGEAAFRWFGLTDSTARAEIDRVWARPDKYSAELRVDLELPGRERRTFTLCAVPHPSGANARWARAFPDLLRSRLQG